MTKTRWLFVFLLLFITLGYCREFFFVHLNIILFETYYHSVSAVQPPAIMNIFRTLSYDTLYYSKYIFTLLWIGIFFAANYFALKKLTSTFFFRQFLFYAYIVMLALAFLTMAYGYVINGHLQDDEYTLSRWLLGIAQSPLICLILVASEKLYNKSFPA